MEHDTNSPDGLEGGHRLYSNPSDNFGAAFCGVDGSTAGDVCPIGDVVDYGGNLPLEQHRPQRQDSAIAIFHHQPLDASDIASATASTMQISPEFAWHAGLQMQDTINLSPSIVPLAPSPESYYNPEYYDSWVPPGQAMVGMEMAMAPPNSIELQRKPREQAEHPVLGQTMTPPDDSFPLPYGVTQQQQCFARQLGLGFGWFPNGGSSSPGTVVSATVDNSSLGIQLGGFSFAQGVVEGDGTRPQLSPLTPSPYHVDSPATYVSSPQPATPGQDRHRASTTVSSPALSTATTTATTTRSALTSAACPTSPSETSQRPRRSRLAQDETTSMSRARHRSGESSNDSCAIGSNGNRRPTSADGDNMQQAEGSQMPAARTKRSSRARGSNRVAAKKCRDKTKRKEQQLEEQVQEDARLNDQLQKEFRAILSEVNVWRSRLLMHGSCDDDNIQAWIKNRAMKM